MYYSYYKNFRTSSSRDKIRDRNSDDKLKMDIMAIILKKFEDRDKIAI